MSDYSISVNLKKWPLYMLLTALISSFLTFAFALPASADTTGPVFTKLYPARGITVKQTKIVISLVAIDTDLIDYSSLVMKVDGLAVSPVAQYTPIDESADDYTTLEIYAPVSLAPGSHTAEVFVKDRKGNSSIVSWSFTVNEPLKILNTSPANGATVVNRTPVISAGLTSGDIVDPATILMTLNNVPVAAVYDSVYETVSYKPEEPLDNETFYDASLTLKDIHGNTVKATWQFYVNTFEEMTYLVDDATCQSCHDRTEHVVDNCSKCHGVNFSATDPVYPLDDCYYCHFDSRDYPAAYHRNGLPLEEPPLHPVQVIYSCTGCHDRGWAATAVPSVHNIFETAVEHSSTTTGCTECHSTVLTREHLRRYDPQGMPLSCFTCHNNPDPDIQLAITSGDSSCGACHPAEMFGHALNRPPVISVARANVTAGEGQLIVNTGAISDPDNDPVTLTASAGEVTDNGDGTWTWSFVSTDGPAQSSTIKITATDGQGNVGETSFELIIHNAAPFLDAISAPIDPVQVNTTVNVTTGFSDSGTADLHSADWEWGDGSSSAGRINESQGSGTASGSHVYTKAGVYTVILTLRDNDGAAVQKDYRYIVVYDADAGFITGGGWIYSPIGAYAADPLLTGRANFGFVSRYLKGAAVPTGNTRFQFKAGSLDFSSSEYEWLVVSGTKGQFKGRGTINGKGSYGFILTALDGDDTGGPDKFRIKIWDRITGDPVYDNQSGAEVTADPAVVLGGGSILIHK